VIALVLLKNQNYTFRARLVPRMTIPSGKKKKKKAIPGNRRAWNGIVIHIS
jgi:hypothetical protein